MRIFFYCQLVLIAAILAFIPSTLKADSHLNSTHRKLKSASELDYPPFATIRPDGSADGFSVDLLKACAQTVGLEVGFYVGPWHEIKQMLLFTTIWVGYSDLYLQDNLTDDIRVTEIAR